MRNQILGIVVLLYLAIGQCSDMPIPCKNTTECTNIPKLQKDAYCKNGYCVCPKDNQIKNCSGAEVMSNNKTTKPLVSRTCKHNHECLLDNGFCNTTISQCDCMKGYVASSNKLECLKVAESIGFACTDDKQCLAFLPNTTCHNKKCACTTNYHFVDKACWKKAGLGQPCNKSQECSHINHAICTKNNVCGCEPGMVNSTSLQQCLPIASKILDECIEDAQCQNSTAFNNSLCIEKKCQCKEKYHFVQEVTNCIPNKVLDESCEHQFECYQKEDESLKKHSMLCLANKCSCADDFNREGNKCVVNTDSTSGAPAISFTFGIGLLTIVVSGMVS